MDFDYACQLRLEIYENERDFQRLKFYKQQFKSALSEWWNGLADSLENGAETDADALSDDDYV